MSGAYTPWRMMPPPTEVTGRIVEVPELTSASLADKERYLRDFMNYGPPTEGPVTEFPPEPEPDPEPSTFNPAALLQPIAGRSERYTMPNGQVVWIHPPSIQDAARANRLALSEVTKLGLVTEDKLPEGNVEYQARGRIYQTIYVCRTGPEITSPLVFKEQHADAFRRNPGYVEVVQEICAISDGLGKGKAESDLLREGYAAFFAGLESVLARLSSAETPDCSPALRNCLAAMTNSVSALRRLNGYSASDLKRAARELNQHADACDS